MKESLSGFSFEYNSRPFEESSRTLVEEGKEFVGMHRLLLYWLSGLSSSVSSFVCKLVSCVYGSLTLLFISYCHVMAHGDEEVGMILPSRVAISAF